MTVTAADGTENTLTDTEYNNDDEHPENENAETAVIKCKDGSDVTLCGSGTLNINANGKNGIKSGASTEEEGEASLSIEEITLNINAPVNDGINAEAYIAVKSGSITVDAGDDGIHCDLIADIGSEGGGGPEINITGCCEGLEAAELNMYSGNIRIYSEDDCLNAANSDLGDYDFSLLIAGGALYMYSVSGDGIDSNSSLTISGGVTEVWTANTADNQPLDADGTITVTGGTVFAAGGSAGMGMNLSSSQANVRYGSASIGGGDHGSFPGGQAPTPPNGTEGESFHESGELTPPGGVNGSAHQSPNGDSEDGENPPEMTMPDRSTSPSDGTFPEAPENPSDGATPPEKPDGGDMPSPRENQGGSTPPSGGFTPGTVSRRRGHRVLTRHIRRKRGRHNIIRRNVYLFSDSTVHRRHRILLIVRSRRRRNVHSLFGLHGERFCGSFRRKCEDHAGHCEQHHRYRSSGKRKHRGDRGA